MDISRSGLFASLKFPLILASQNVASRLNIVKRRSEMLRYMERC